MVTACFDKKLREFCGGQKHLHRGLSGFVGCIFNCTYCVARCTIRRNLGRADLFQRTRVLYEKALCNGVWTKVLAKDLEMFFTVLNTSKATSFINTLSDGRMLLEDEEARINLFAAALGFEQHLFTILSHMPPVKRISNLPENMRIGVSVTCNADLHKIPRLKEMVPYNRVVHFKPLLEDLIQLRPSHLEGLQRIEIGFEHRTGNLGHHVTPCHHKWVVKILNMAHQVGIPYEDRFVEGARDNYI